jgi:hypothetical protein
MIFAPHLTSLSLRAGEFPQGRGELVAQRRYTHTRILEGHLGQGIQSQEEASPAPHILHFFVEGEQRKTGCLFGVW